MMTTPKEREVKKDEKMTEENFFFDNSEDIVLTEKEIKNLEYRLENKETDEKTRAFFKSAHYFSKKLRENDYTISLEEIEKL